MPDPVWILQKNFRHEIVEIVRITDVLGLQDGNQALIGMFDRIPEGRPIRPGLWRCRHSGFETTREAYFSK